MTIRKELAGVEDLALGMGSVSQVRNGTSMSITQLNGNHIPFDTSTSITSAIRSSQGVLSSHLTGTNPHNVGWGQLRGDINQQPDLLQLLDTYCEIGTIQH